MSPADMPNVASEPSAAGDGELPVPGDLVYEYTPNVTEIVEYGASADAVLMRKSAPPKEGARLDLYLQGPLVAGKLKGTFRGVDYLNVRADGRVELHIHGQITLEDGKTVALEAGGVGVPQGVSPIYRLREHVQLTSNHPELAWVNETEVWARGQVDVSTGKVHLTAYAV
jgi:Protein of unknown function (DUF3237)